MARVGGPRVPLHRRIGREPAQLPSHARCVTRQCTFTCDKTATVTALSMPDARTSYPAKHASVQEHHTTHTRALAIVFAAFLQNHQKPLPSSASPRLCPGSSLASCTPGHAGARRGTRGTPGLHTGCAEALSSKSFFFRGVFSRCRFTLRLRSQTRRAARYRARNLSWPCRSRSSSSSRPWTRSSSPR